MKIVSAILILFVFLGFGSCRQAAKKLPVLGNPLLEGSDSVYPVIAPFSFTDQDSNTIKFMLQILFLLPAPASVLK